MTADTQHRHDHTLWIGLLAGTAIGAGLAMWLLPRATGELREHVTESVNDLRTFASDPYRNATTHVEEAAAAVDTAVGGLKS